MLDLIRGRDVNAALATLRFARKGVARDIEKVLRSAIANASQKDGFGGDVERLFVNACYANQGPSQKRIRPAPMGRAFRIVKRTAHLTVQVSERPVHVSAPIPTGGPDAPKRPRGAKPKATRSCPGDSGEAEREGGRCPEEDGGGEERPCEEGESVGAVREPPLHMRVIGWVRNASARIPARLQQDVAVALVRRQGLLEAAPRGSEAARHAQDAVRARRCLELRSSAPPS